MRYTCVGLALVGLALGVGVRAAETTQPDEQLVTVRGQVMEVRPEKQEFSLRTTDGRHLLLAGSKERMDPGARVEVTYKTSNGQNWVVRVVREPVKAEVNRQRGDDYRKWEAALQRLDKQIDELKDRAAHASADLQAKYADEIAALKRQSAVARQRLDRARTVGADAWGDVKTGLGQAVDDLKKAYERARERFTK